MDLLVQEAARNNDLTCLQRLLLENGHQINIADLHHALLIASEGGYTDIIDILIKYGVDVNTHNGKGRTPLMLAIRNCHYESVELLLYKGAEVNKIDCDENTPLKLAVKHFTRYVTRGYTYTGRDELKRKILKILIYKSEKLDFIYKFSATPLMLLSETIYTGCLQMLLERGCRVADVDEDGEAALDYAVRSNQAENVQILLQYGAKRIFPIFHGLKYKTFLFLVQNGCRITNAEEKFTELFKILCITRIPISILHIMYQYDVCSLAVIYKLTQMLLSRYNLSATDNKTAAWLLTVCSTPKSLYRLAKSTILPYCTNPEKLPLPNDVKDDLIVDLNKNKELKDRMESIIFDD